MGIKTPNCAKCGNLLSYDDSLWQKTSWDRRFLGGYICSVCAYLKRQEKKQEEYLKEERRRTNSESHKNKILAIEQEEQNRLLQRVSEGTKEGAGWKRTTRTEFKIQIR